jgi:thioredoxin reductase
VNGSTPDVAIIGAGPYGLASSAHLLNQGLRVHVFGEPMEFWKTQMPKGMFLRSSWEASSIASPGAALSLEAYQGDRGRNVPAPVPLGDFIEYGQWFQQHAMPDVDRRRVLEVNRNNGGFELRMDDGDRLEARRVVVAGGISPFADRPEAFDQLPRSLASHSSDHTDLSCFKGQPVAVIGGGQSAIEFAALLHEAGAEVEVIMRGDHVRWLTRGVWLRRKLSPIKSLLYPPTDVGPPVLNQIVAHPEVFKLFPQRLQERIAYRCIRPAASGWLIPRTGDVKITTEREVISATQQDDAVSLTLNDGTSRLVKHVLLATGFRVDVSRYPFLSRDVAQAVSKVDGYPKLKKGFESSVRGLHFVGAPAAHSYGPLMRFVSGTKFTGRELTSGIIRRS